MLCGGDRRHICMLCGRDKRHIRMLCSRTGGTYVCCVVGQEAYNKRAWMCRGKS